MQTIEFSGPEFGDALSTVMSDLKTACSVISNPVVGTALSIIPGVGTIVGACAAISKGPDAAKKLCSLIRPVLPTLEKIDDPSFMPNIPTDKIASACDYIEGKTSTAPRPPTPPSPSYATSTPATSTRATAAAQIVGTPTRQAFPVGTVARYHKGEKAWWIYLPTGLHGLGDVFGETPALPNQKIPDPVGVVPPPGASAGAPIVPLYLKWWFWASIAGAVAASATGVVIYVRKR